MTISQGEVLIKLIDRETGNTSYAMVKDLKGGFKAFVYPISSPHIWARLKRDLRPGRTKRY